MQSIVKSQALRTSPPSARWISSDTGAVLQLLGWRTEPKPEPKEMIPASFLFPMHKPWGLISTFQCPSGAAVWENSCALLDSVGGPLGLQEEGVSRMCVVRVVCVKVWWGFEALPVVSHEWALCGAESDVGRGELCSPQEALAGCVCCVSTCVVLLHTLFPGCVLSLWHAEDCSAWCAPRVCVAPKSRLRQAMPGLCGSRQPTARKHPIHNLYPSRRGEEHRPPK